MNKKIIYAAILLVFTVLIVIYYQNTSASKTGLLGAALYNPYSPSYWLDNPKDALIFESWYSVQPMTSRRSDSPDDNLDAKFYQGWYVGRLGMNLGNSIPDYPLDGKFFIEYFSLR